VTIIGLTGNLASGKSETAKLFEKKGARVINADEIARRLTEENAAIRKAIAKMFGRQYVTKSGALDRRKLAWHVFADPKELKKLNTIVHPIVIVEIYKQLEKHRSKKGLVILDVPLLFESKMEKLADFTVVVKASEANMVSRASRRGIPAALARKILAAQWPVMRKARLADFVIDNNGTPEQLAENVERVAAEISKQQKARESGFYGTAKKV
jgi:dephospho-CoA kinase